MQYGDKDYKVDLKKFITTETFSRDMFHADIKASDVVRAVENTLKDYEAARTVKENVWLECWAKYFGSPEANAWVRGMAHRTVGDISTNWRHRVTTSKGYEVVETINAYFQAATFPSRNWFTLLPVTRIGDPEYKKLLAVLTKFLRKKLDDANIQSNWDMFCRQMIVTGTSVLALPWRYDVRSSKKNTQVFDPNSRLPVVSQKSVEKVVYNGLDLEVLDMFETYLDPSAKNQSNPNIIRKFSKTKAELVRLTEMGVYSQAKPEWIKKLKSLDFNSRGNQGTAEGFTGVQGNSYSWKPQDKVSVTEFWGNIVINDVEFYDVVITVADGCLLHIASNPFWNGKPFIVGTYTPVINSPYGLGALEPSLGNLHVQDLTLNQRLDGTEVSLNPMFEVLNDGTIDPDDVYSEPGKVFLVSQPNSIRPIQRDLNMSSSIQEEDLQEQRINKATGIGAYLGVNSGRSGERVTAEEVRIQREAGGNRLNRIHRHIETTALVPMLNKAYGYCQQFVVSDEVLRVRSDKTPDAFEYIQVGIQELSFDMDVYAYGADYVADREYELRQRLDFLNLVSSAPQMGERINWEEMLKDLAQRFLDDEFERFITEPPPQPQQGGMPPGMPMPDMEPPQPPMPGMPMAEGSMELPPEAMQAVMDKAKGMGGESLQNALQTQVATTGVDSTLEQLSSVLGTGQTKNYAV